MSAKLQLKESETYHNKQNLEVKNTEQKNSNLRIVSRGTFSGLSDLLLKGVEDGAFPGAVIIVGKKGQEVFKSAVGFRSVKTNNEDQPKALQLDTVFDIGELTQQFATTSVIMQLVTLGHCNLDDLVSRHLQCFSVNGKASITIRQLLSHTSGLPSDVAFYEQLQQADSTTRMGILTSRGARDFVYNSLNRLSVKNIPGTQETYSKLNFIILGHLIETLTGMDLSKAVDKYVFKPLGLKASSFIDLALIKRHGLKPVEELIAPTEECSWRKKILCGEVQDENAWAMGGVAGHAGVFCQAQDLHNFTVELLRAYFGQSQVFNTKVVREFWTKNNIFDGERQIETTFALGWQKACGLEEMSELGFSEEAIGFNASNGCSIWIDPKYATSIVFLNNSMHPKGVSRKVKEIREEVLYQVNLCLNSGK